MVRPSNHSRHVMNEPFENLRVAKHSTFFQAHFVTSSGLMPNSHNRRSNPGRST